MKYAKRHASARKFPVSHLSIVPLGHHDDSIAILIVHFEFCWKLPLLAWRRSQMCLCPLPCKQVYWEGVSGTIKIGSHTNSHFDFESVMELKYYFQPTTESLQLQCQAALLEWFWGNDRADCGVKGWFPGNPDHDRLLWGRRKTRHVPGTLVDRGQLVVQGGGGHSWPLWHHS